ncbi:MAG: DNA-processing protein DprA, partial [Gemmatimonadota bacterium]|nr:DNA-processing protein DprA [Gemmatimonadota bacterium]
MTDRESLCRLGVVTAPRVGPMTARKLFHASGAWEAVARDAARGRGPASSRLRPGIGQARDRGEKIAAACQRTRTRVLFRGDPGWPKDLARVPDEPEVLFLRGDPTALEERGVAIVGARECSPDGRGMAFDLGAGLASEGWSVVSGLARGIDGGAHEGALSGQGVTVAVLGCGPDVVYPREHAALQDRIADEGLLLSEFPPGTDPRPGHFPRRNRVLSALSEATVVVEGRMRSGALVTARHALDQGREVFVVPGWPTAPLSDGPLSLLRQGARPVRGAADLLEDLGGISGGLALDPEEVRAREALEGGATTPDALAEELGVDRAHAQDLL